MGQMDEETKHKWEGKMSDRSIYPYLGMEWNYGSNEGRVRKLERSIVV